MKFLYISFAFNSSVLYLFCFVLYIFYNFDFGCIDCVSFFHHLINYSTEPFTVIFSKNVLKSNKICYVIIFNREPLANYDNDFFPDYFYDQRSIQLFNFWKMF